MPPGTATLAWAGGLRSSPPCPSPIARNRETRVLLLAQRPWGDNQWNSQLPQELLLQKWLRKLEGLEVWGEIALPTLLLCVPPPSPRPWGLSM